MQENQKDAKKSSSSHLTEWTISQRGSLTIICLRFNLRTERRYGSGWSPEQVNALRAEIGRLKPKLRIVVELLLSELSTTEVAQQLGVANATVRFRVATAIKILRQRLAE